MSRARLAHQMRVLWQGAMPPLWDRLDELALPVTLIVGTDDEKYAAIGAEIADRVEQARLVTIAGGHALPLEAPDLLARELASVHAAVSR